MAKRPLGARLRAGRGAGLPGSVAPFPPPKPDPPLPAPRPEAPGTLPEPGEHRFPSTIFGSGGHQPHGPRVALELAAPPGTPNSRFPIARPGPPFPSHSGRARRAGRPRLRLPAAPGPLKATSGRASGAATPPSLSPRRPESRRGCIPCAF